MPDDSERSKLNDRIETAALCSVIVELADAALVWPAQHKGGSVPKVICGVRHLAWWLTDSILSAVRQWRISSVELNEGYEPWGL